MVVEKERRRMKDVGSNKQENWWGEGSTICPVNKE